MAVGETREQRQDRLDAALLYLVCGLKGDPPDPSPLAELVREAVAGGVEIVQLREKRLPDDELVAVATRRGCCASGSARC